MRSPVQEHLDRLHRALSGRDHGAVASYIPELAKADPRAFGIAVATVQGHVYESGDTRAPFTIQSISKPLVYGVALQDRGAERVRQAVGVEPSGEAFNSISLEPGSGRPMNPMINAGAIAVSSLVPGASRAGRLERVVGAISACAGRELDVDPAVYASERDTGHRNRAIGHLLRNYDIVQGDPEDALDLYFHQCAVRIDCRDLALIGATLANGGRHPLTGVQALGDDVVGAVLSVMATCGVYDFSGEWTTRVGLPAKSGVGGGIVAVLPGQLAIAVFSPPLDERGNSVRGVAACEALSRDWRLHGLQPPRAAASTVRADCTLAQRRSKRQRSAQESAWLDEHGRQVRVLELQGDLHFGTLEPVLAAVVGEGPPPRALVLDFKRVGHVDGAAARLLADLISRFAAHDAQVLLTRVRRGGALAALDAAMDPRAAPALSFHPQLDLGLEACEQRLLRRPGAPAAPAALAGLHEHALLAGVTSDDLHWLAARVPRTHHEPGALLVRRGEPADAVYLLLRGQVSVVVDLPGGGQRRLSTLIAGMAFGEQGLLEAGRRGADVRADTEVEAAVLTREAFQALERERPTLAIGLLRNLLATAARTAVRLTAEVAALEA